MRISVQFVKMGPLVSDCYSLAVSLVERRGLSDGEGYLSIGYHRHSRATQKLRETKSSRLWLFIFLIQAKHEAAENAPVRESMTNLPFRRDSLFPMPVMFADRPDCHPSGDSPYMQKVFFYLKGRAKTCTEIYLIKSINALRLASLYYRSSSH
jgi:hypothetical protein